MEETSKSRKAKAKSDYNAACTSKSIPQAGVNNPGLWNQLAYSGKDRVPTGIAPLCGSWPQFYLQRDSSGKFINPLTKEPIADEIRHPNSIRFADELEVVKETLTNLTPDMYSNK